MMNRTMCFVVVTLLSSGISSARQQPAAPTEPAPAAQPPTATEASPALPTPPPNFQYTPDGRRDPFLSLINRGTDARSGIRADARRVDGPEGLTTAELVVRGILQSRGTWVALVAGPSGKVFTVRTGDRLSDGVIRTITPQAVVILQEVNDPLSLEKQREVRKLLRGGEEVK